MKIELAYAKGLQSLEIDDQKIQQILEPNAVEVDLVGEAEVIRSLENPIASEPLAEIIQPGEKIAIVTSDITRPLPSKIILPPLLREIEKSGASLADITIVIALGSHRGQTPEELENLLGQEVYQKVKVVNSDAEGFVHMGETSGGTPIDIAKAVAEADRIICLGNIEYHYFMGYSGGIKAIMPGVSTAAAIQANHSRMVEEAAHAGKLEGNPVREDIEEVRKTVKVDFIVNVVLDEHKKIIKSFAGDVVEAHHAGCKFLDGLYKVKIKERADIVLVSPGGYPKDINLYQAQKGLDNAKHAVKDGGVIILCASCVEGLGNKTFERWMTGFDNVDDLVHEIGVHFELGGHKAAAIGMVMQHCDVYLVSDMEPDFVESLFFKPFSDLATAYAAAEEKLGKDASVIVMPYGGSTLPVS